MADYRIYEKGNRVRSLPPGQVDEAIVEHLGHTYKQTEEFSGAYQSLISWFFFGCISKNTWENKKAWTAAKQELRSVDKETGEPNYDKAENTCALIDWFAENYTIVAWRR